MRCELFQSSFFNVLEATYFGMLLKRSANPSGSFRPGQAAAKPSYVTRPRRRASEAKVSSDLNFHSASSPNWNVHFSGDSTTPSNDMNSVAAKVRVAGINPSLPRKQPEVQTFIFQHSLRKLSVSGDRARHEQTLAQILDSH